MPEGEPQPDPKVSPGRALLVRLYPRAWRDRYGPELEALLAEQKLSFGIVFDLMGGALDARLSPVPNLTANLSPTHGAPKMNTTWLARCASGAPRLTIRESLAGAGIILLGTLLLSTAHVLLKQAYGPLPAISALKESTFSAILLLSANSIYLQRRSWRAQVAFVGGFLSVIYLIFLAAHLAA